MVITLPAAVGLAVMAKPILVTLFQYGEFSTGDVDMAALSLMAFAFGLPAFIAIKVLAPGYFARQDSKTPVKIGLIAMAANVGLNLLFVGALLKIEFNGVHMGLAAASAASGWLNAGLLFRGLRRENVYRPLTGWLRFACSVLLACTAMAAVLIWITPHMSQWVARGALDRAWLLTALIGAGVLVYAGIGWVSGIRPGHFSKGGH